MGGFCCGLLFWICFAGFYIGISYQGFTANPLFRKAEVNINNDLNNEKI